MLGKGYRAPMNCQYAKHPETSKTKGTMTSWLLYQFVKTIDPNFVLGSLICKQCQLKLNSKNADAKKESNDPDFIPNCSIVGENRRLEKREKLDALTNIFEVERFR